jgi:hypothetical protein
MLGIAERTFQCCAIPFAIVGGRRDRSARSFAPSDLVGGRGSIAG